MVRRLTLLSLAVTGLPALVTAGEMLQTSADGTVVFRGSYGITAIEANELVYAGKSKVSQLIWRSTAVSTFTGALTAELDEFYLRAAATIGIGGDGHMKDYDWLVDGRAWSDRSIHPDTRLDHYFAGSIEGGREILSHGNTRIALGGGARYTDVKWTAWGGSYVYSFSDFRDTRGKFPDDEKAISYRQQWPVPFLAVNVVHSEGPWTFSSAFQGGVALKGRGTDDHWMRALRFVDNVDATPAMMISGAAEYELRPDTAIFVSGAFDRIFRARADTTMVDRMTGDKSIFKDGAGADYMSMTLSLGLRGKF